MRAEEPRVSDAGRYSIGQTCQALGIHRNTLRRYTDEGLIKARVRRGTLKTFYLGSDILRFWRALA